MPRPMLVPFLLVASPAWAQSLPEPGLVEFLPAGSIVGDGRSPATLYVLALDPSGAPISGLDARVSASDGDARAFREVGQGIYAFEYQPPLVTGRAPVTLELTGRTPGRDKVRAEVAFDLLPPPPHGMAVAVAPDRLVTGEDLGATLSVRLEGAAPEAGGLLVHAVEAEVKALEPQGDGSFTARLVPKTVNYPHLALITVADRRDPSGARGHVVVPVSGKVDYPLNAAPGASVSLEIAGRSFGPVTASPEGKVAIPVVVPPGEKTARVTTVVEGAPIQTEIDLQIPETKRLALFPLPAGLPADPDVVIPVRVLVRQADGSPDTAASVQLEASAGSIGEATHEGDGVYVARLVPPAGDAAADLEVTARIAGQDKQTDAITVSLVPRLAGRIDVSAEPEVLPPGGTELSVTARLVDAAGEPVAGSVAFAGGGATALGEPERTTPGTLHAEFETNASGPVEVLAYVEGEAAGNPLRHLLLLPGRELIENDGASGTPVVVLATDSWGQPVPGVTVSLDVVGTDGTLTPSVTTDAHGVGLALYTAGRQPSLAKVRARSGSASGAAAILQVPPEVPWLDLPPVGGDEAAAWTASWDARVELVRVEHEGEASSAWIAAAQGAPPPVPPPAIVPDHPVSERPPVVDRDGDRPWLRLRGSYVFSTYWYEQAPSNGGGPLIGEVLSVGGERGDKNAMPQGFEVQGRAWIPGFHYVGFLGGYRATYYGITAEAFAGQVAPDTLHTVEAMLLGRFPFEVEGGLFHVGARAGFHLGDFIYFTGSLDEALVNYDTLAVPGLGLGAEIGGEIGRAWLVAGLTQSLAYGSNAYATSMDFTAGYGLSDHVTFDVGLASVARRILVVGATSGQTHGELSDGQLLFKAGLGLAF